MAHCKPSPSSAQYSPPPTIEELEIVEHWHRQGVFLPSVPVAYVYLMGHGDLHKIGLSKNPLKRVTTVKRIYPDMAIELVSAFDVVLPGTLEIGLHFHFMERHVAGEWFRLSPLEVVKARRLIRAWRQVYGAPS